MKAISWLLAVLLMLGLLSVSMPATSAGCFSLVSDLQRNWIEVRRYLLPLGASFENNPSNEQFVCVSNYTVRHALERKAGTTSISVVSVLPQISLVSVVMGRSGNVLD